MTRFALPHLFATALLLGVAGGAQAHSISFKCQADGAQHIQCQGGFSDGSDARGVDIRVKSYEDKVLHQGTLDDNSQIRFERPKQDFYVQMDAGEGHSAEIDHADIQ